jgi:ribonuclease HII
MIAGLDEAGRGSVLGPLVVAGIMIKGSKVRKLRSLGVADSKKLTPKNRETLYREILKVVDAYCIRRVNPADIDRYVSVRGLNSLEALTMASIIDKLRPRIAYVDSCDVNPKRFKESIVSRLRCRTRVDSRHHADSEKVVVSAASILAKVRRDREIEKLRRNVGNVGSGYPSDRQTMKFVDNWICMHKRVPEFVRASWKPVRQLVEVHLQPRILDFTQNVHRP